MRLLKAERKRRGWTQTALGTRAGMTAAEVSNIETGRLRPTPAQIARLARALRLSRGVLLVEVSTELPG